MSTPYQLDSEIYDYLETHLEAKPKDLMLLYGKSGRTARRMVQHFRSGNVERKVFIKEVKAVAQSMVDIEEPEEWDVEIFLKEAPKMVEQNQKTNPILTYDVHEFDLDYPIAVMFASCMHLGGRYTAYDEFKEIFQRALNIPHLYFAMMGDDVEGFPSYFFDVKAVQDQLIQRDRQLLVLEHVLDRINQANKLLYGTGSQHGGKWQEKKEGKNDVKDMYLHSFNVPFYDGAAYLTFKVGQEEYLVATAHEFPGNSQYNPSHPQKRALLTRFPNADVIVMGDKHTPAMQYQTVYTDEVDKGNRRGSGVWLLQSGTMKTGPDHFAVTNGYPRGEMGWPIAVFHPKFHCVEVTLSLARVEQMLKDNIEP